MKHAGKARQAGLKIMVVSLVIVVLMIAGWSFFAGRVLNGVAFALGALWMVFFVFSLSFFRDPEPVIPAEARAIVSPGHGTVDVIDETVEKAFMGGPCRRISIFLSVFDVHVQNAPASGRVGYLKHCPGKFVNAMRSDCGSYNENVLIGNESSGAGRKTRGAFDRGAFSSPHRALGSNGRYRRERRTNEPHSVWLASGPLSAVDDARDGRAWRESEGWRDGGCNARVIYAEQPQRRAERDHRLDETEDLFSAEPDDGGKSVLRVRRADENCGG